MYRGKPAEARDGYLNYVFLQVRNVIRFVNAKGVSASTIKRFENEGETSVSRWKLVLSSYLREQIIVTAMMPYKVFFIKMSEVNKPQNHNFTEKNQILQKYIARKDEKQSVL